MILFAVKTPLRKLASLTTVSMRVLHDCQCAFRYAIRVHWYPACVQTIRGVWKPIFQTAAPNKKPVSRGTYLYHQQLKLRNTQYTNIISHQKHGDDTRNVWNVKDVCCTLHCIAVADRVSRTRSSFMGLLLHSCGDTSYIFVLWPGETIFSDDKCDLTRTVE